MSFQVERVISERHPCLAGHFPGDPIVPGALILDEVWQAACEWRGRMRLKTISSVKFRAPLEPGNPFSIALREASPTEIVFECRQGESTLACGTLTVESDAAGS